VLSDWLLVLRLLVLCELELALDDSERLKLDELLPVLDVLLLWLLVLELELDPELLLERSSQPKISGCAERWVSAHVLKRSVPGMPDTPPRTSMS
jgi:hypothetical protein